MKIALVTGNTLKAKNTQIFETLKITAERYNHEVFNYGILENSDEIRSYVDSAILACQLLNERKADFVVCGCSSGLGMQLAMNSTPNVLCGYGTTPIEANLFARINKGNAFSYPFALNWGWGAEEAFRLVLEALFSGLSEAIYPANQAERKELENEKLYRLNKISKISYTEWQKKVKKLK